MQSPGYGCVRFMINNIISGSAERSRFANHRSILYEMGIWRCSQVNILRWGINDFHFKTAGQALFLEQFKSSLDAVIPLELMWFSVWFRNPVPLFTDASFTALVNHTYCCVCLIYSKLHQWAASIILRIYFPVVLNNSLFWESDIFLLLAEE